jgi:hypothetical protein
MRGWQGKRSGREHARRFDRKPPNSDNARSLDEVAVNPFGRNHCRGFVLVS